MLLIAGVPGGRLDGQSGSVERLPAQFTPWSGRLKQNFENPLRQDLELRLWILLKKKFRPIRSIYFAQSCQPT